MTTRKYSASLLEYYRCPDDFAQVGVAQLTDTLRGFFKFGDNVICYGQCACGSPSSHLNGDLRDVWPDIQMNGSGTILPFDPDEVLTNLRQERYVAASAANIRSNFYRTIRHIYYGLRPAIPFGLRSSLKRAYLAGWEKIPFPQWPVDTTVDALLKRLLELSLVAGKGAEIPFIWFWPKGYKSCLVMTHDIETAAGLQFVATVMELDKSAGIKASFQIIPEGRYVVTDTILHNIRSNGFEINIHDLNHDGKLFDNHRKFLQRAQLINHYSRKYSAAGYRTGVMYRNQSWYGAFEFEYDMSVPNVAHLDPQRGGCCTVMPYFIGNIVELPLTTAQDYFIFYILKDRSIELWRQQIEKIAQQHGMMSFIIHPDYVIDKRNLSTFQALLEYLVALQKTGCAWVAQPGEVNYWWRQRSKMRLILEPSGWQIKGEGSDRACVAFAYLRDGKLAYRISQPFSASNAIDNCIKA